ncbi:MAG: F0F1 ATP synthase subunit epsilon [Planctomycetales bacterium]|nr:F0F1 ATP synthase subunit epsilon [Planctomycetales bacterium]
MILKIQTPSEIITREVVTKVIAEAENGCFCLLPRHVDFLAALVPGLIIFEDQHAKEHFVAVGEGLLVKRDDTVLVSVRHAIRGGDLGELRRSVREQLAIIDDREKATHAAVAKLEASFLRGYVELVGESI